MSFDPISAGFDLGKTILDKFFPDADAEMKLKMEQAANEINNEFQLQLEQIKLNQKEAENNSVFVSGWRPAVGWTCCLSLMYVSILNPIGQFIAKVFFQYTGEFPVIDTSLTLQVLIGLLGLGGLRTIEKYHGIARK